jgi:phospholipid-binding lipoprotein MlaA
MQSIKRTAAAVAVGLIIIAVLTGCTTLKPGQADPRDPYQPFNRSIYKFNTTFDHAILRPVARTYVKATPVPVRQSISNFMTNLDYPVTVVNDFLQGKVHDGFNDMARFLVNSIFGVGGLFDPATRTGLDKNDEDFGLTLGHWGVPTGPYVLLPFLGPSSLRDAPAKLVDEYTSPRAYIADQWTRWSLFLVGKVDARADLLGTDKVIDSAYDPYAFMRNAWLQHRYYEVHGDNPPPEEPPDDGSAAAPDAKQ